MGPCGLRALLLLPLPLLLVTVGPTAALTEDERQLMVQLHNLFRAQVSPPASDMLRMRWDPELAAFAKAYAQKCVWGHNKERGRRGENLFAITDEGLDVPLAMEEWNHEHEHYNLSAASCAAGQMCGHYTQVVWGKTERIGCGSHFCEALQGVEETNIHLLVCNYEPPGNVKGQRPYREGTPCSQCPPNYRCQNALCEPVETEPVGPPAEEQDEEQDRPPSATEAPPPVRAEASDPREARPPSLAPEVPRFSVTRVSGSPKATSPAASSLAPEKPTSPTTAAPRSRGSAVPWVLAAPALLPQEDEPGALPRSTRVPVPSATEGARGTSACPTGEVSAPLDPARPLPGLPGDSAHRGALALRAPRPGAEGPGAPGGEPRRSAGHAWVPALALLLLLLPAPLLWAGPL